ncbi:MAG: hypothetical protein H6624_06775 [Bdellovibrionaceae bacterium]|nr:hypothetical protein [Bdellovibrionales bacterium]MCB9084029.1 hypothetical protein [Pseudobdellovibrionaceae bacterium]
MSFAKAKSILTVVAVAISLAAGAEVADSRGDGGGGDRDDYGHARPDTPKKPPVISSPVRWQCTPFRAVVADDHDTPKQLLKKLPFDYKCQNFDDEGYIKTSVNLEDGWWIFADRYGKLHVELKGEDGKTKHMRVYMADHEGNIDPRNSKIVQTSSNGDLVMTFRLNKTVKKKRSKDKTEDIVIDLRCRAKFNNRCS